MGNQFESELRRLILKSGVSLVLKCGGAIAGLLVSIVIGRNLGTADAGRFFLCLSVVTVTAAVARLGFDQPLTRFISEYHEKNNSAKINELYTVAITIVFVVSTTLALILASLAVPISNHIFSDPKLSRVFLWMMLAIPGFSLAWLHSHFFQGSEEISLFQFFQNLGISLLFLIGILVSFLVDRLWISGRVEHFGMVFLAAASITSVLAHVVWRSRWSDYSWTSLANCRPTLQFRTLLPFWLMLVISQISTWFPQLLLGACRPPDDVGVFTAAFRIANLTSMVLAGVNSVAFPRFAVLYSSGKTEQLKALVFSSTRLMLLLCTPFFIALLAMPEFFLGFFGANFIQGGVLLRIIALGQLVNVATGSVAGLLYMSGHQEEAFRASLLGLVLTLLTGVPLIPLFGAVGAAIAGSLSTTGILIALSLACKRTLGYMPIQSILTTRFR